LTHVSIKQLTKVYPGSVEPSLDRLSLEIASGELTALLGPSGCGKTTTMKMIAGLLPQTSGDVLFDGRSVLKDKPENRGVVMVFQNYLLFPYMSVAANIGFGLKMRKVSQNEIDKRVTDMLELVKLPDLGSRKPSELSGGQQQRVALARALIVQPNVLLLDEPLSNLDAHLRFEMRDLIRNLQQEMGITTIFVTHDQEEAVVLADKVALILDGRLKQYDESSAFYSRPVDKATALFFGGQNFIDGHVETRTQGSVFESELGTMQLMEETANGPGTLTIRPENIRIGSNPGGTNSITAGINNKIYMGTQTRLQCQIGECQLQVIANPNDVHDYQVGQNIDLFFPENALWVVHS